MDWAELQGFGLMGGQLWADLTLLPTVMELLACELVNLATMKNWYPNS